MTSRVQSVIAILTAATLGAAPAMAAPAETCFTAFSGTVHYQFAAKSSAFTGTGTHSIPGVVFGDLTSCAGLNRWGVVGTATGDGTNTILGLRDETADASSCGAVDVTVSLSPTTLTGPLQLFNERTDFGNSDTLTKATCVTPPSVPGHQGRDVLGNGR
jgi:hypothetical protein